MSLPALQELRAQIDAVAERHRVGEALPTGVAALDAALATQGIPRGRLTEIVGAHGSGKTTLVRGLVAQTIERGEWVAYIDARRTLAPRDWARFVAVSSGVWMARPRSAARAAWCADVLLRSGAFGLVIVDGAPPLGRTVAARLTRLARDAGAALVVTADDDESRKATSAVCFPAVRLRIARRHRARERSPSDLTQRWRDVPHESSEMPSPQSLAHTVIAVITVDKGGIGRRTVEVMYGWSVARRLCTYPEVPDRRGVERASSQTSQRSGAEAGAARSALAAPTSDESEHDGHREPFTRVPPRSPRCAEPTFGSKRTPRPLGRSHAGMG